MHHHTALRLAAAAAGLATLAAPTATHASTPAPTTQVVRSHGVVTSNYPARSPFTRWTSATTFEVDHQGGVLLVTAHIGRILPATAIAAHQGVQSLSLVLSDESGLSASISDGDCSVIRLKSAAPDLHRCAGTLHEPSFVVRHGRTIQWRVPLAMLREERFSPRVHASVVADYARWDGSHRSLVAVTAPRSIRVTP